MTKIQLKIDSEVKLRNINEKLRDAIKRKDKKAIIELYAASNRLNLQIVDNDLYSEYDDLISKANDILYTK